MYYGLETEAAELDEPACAHCGEAASMHCDLLNGEYLCEECAEEEFQPLMERVLDRL